MKWSIHKDAYRFKPLTARLQPTREICPTIQVLVDIYDTSFSDIPWAISAMGLGPQLGMLYIWAYLLGIPLFTVYVLA